MGRYIGASSGSDVIVKAGEAILAGDVVCVSPAGVVYRGTGDRAYDAASNAPTVRRVNTYSTLNIDLTWLQTTIDSTLCTLGNGNLVLCGQKYYSTPSAGYKPTFTIVTPYGTEVVAATDITTSVSASVWKIKPVKLDADRFLVLYGLGTDKSLYFSIFANDGTQLKGQTDTGVDAEGIDVNYATAIALENGDIIFGYVTSSQWNTLRFDSAGDVKGTTKTWSSYNQTAILPGIGGDFTLWRAYPSSLSWTGAIVSDTDTSRATLSGLSLSVSLGYISGTDSMCITDNGLYVGVENISASTNLHRIFCVGASTSWGKRYYIVYYDAATMQESAPIVKHIGNNRVAVLTNHNVDAYGSYKQFILRVFDCTTGYPVPILEEYIGTPMLTTAIASGSYFSADVIGGRLLLNRFQHSSAYFTQHKTFVVDPNTGKTIGDELELYRQGLVGASSGTSAGYWRNISRAVSGNSVCLFGYWIGHPTGHQTRAMFISANESNILGVAKAAATKGQDVIVGQTGKFAINQTYATTSLGKHDTLPGVTGILDGNVAYLAGA